MPPTGAVSTPYTRIVLAFLAALVPIIGSLYAGGSFLAEHARAARERSVRKHVQRLVDERIPAAEERAVAWLKRNPGQRSYGPYPELQEYERMLLAAHGIEGEDPTRGDVDVSLAMSSWGTSPRELRRQAVLLATATAGVVLLAMDAIATAAAQAPSGCC